MKILISLTYYKPYTSGVISYNDNLAKGLAARGHQVTILTSQYDQDLSKKEDREGVVIQRLPVTLRVSKGVLMRTFPLEAFRLLRSHDLAILNLPNTPVESFFLPLFCKLLGKKMIAVYHCKVVLPEGLFNSVVQWVVFISSSFAKLLSDRIVCYTEDYASQDGVCRVLGHKLAVIPPPINMPAPDAREVAEFRHRHAPGQERLIGFAGRMATEKGVEYLIQAIPLIQTHCPEVRVLFAGEESGVIGEEKYRERLKPMLRDLEDRWVSLGVLDPSEMNVFYGACDLLVLPSTNPTESFGFVQVESMLCGTPVVASNIPGVRTPIQTTGMGLLVEPGDPQTLADAIVRILENKSEFQRNREMISKEFSVHKTLDEFEGLFASMETSE